MSQVPTGLDVMPCQVAAGFYSPAEGRTVQRLDRIVHFMKDAQITFLRRMRCDAMKEADILDNDMLLA